MAIESIDTGLRHVRCLELLAVDGWRIKLYGMGLTTAPPRSDWVEEGRQLIRKTLPTPARTDTRHGVGFAILHAGEDGRYLLLDWWARGDLLKQHLFGAPHHPAGNLRYGWPRGVLGCVWEMAVPWFERNAWWRHVLSRPDAPDLDGYLAERLEGSV